MRKIKNLKPEIYLIIKYISLLSFESLRRTIKRESTGFTHVEQVYGKIPQKSNFLTSADSLTLYLTLVRLYPFTIYSAKMEVCRLTN